MNQYSIKICCTFSPMMDLLKTCYTKVFRVAEFESEVKVPLCQAKKF